MIPAQASISVVLVQNVNLILDLVVTVVVDGHCSALQKHFDHDNSRYPSTLQGLVGGNDVKVDINRGRCVLADRR